MNRNPGFLKFIVASIAVVALNSCCEATERPASRTPLTDSAVSVEDVRDRNRARVYSDLDSSSMPGRTFLSRDTSEDGLHVHAVFFDSDSASPFYRNIASFDFHEFDGQSYENSLRFLLERKQGLLKGKPVIPIRNWVVLKKYKGIYCAYYPSDFYTHFRQSINDSTFIDWTGEGPVANKISAQRRIDSTTYEFKLTGVEIPERLLTIRIINPEKGIAIFETHRGNSDPEYRLMIDADKITRVPVLVNYGTCKYLEIVPEQIKYEQLVSVE